MVFDSAVDTFTLGELLDYRRLCSWFADGPESMDQYIRQVRHVELPYDVLPEDLFAEAKAESPDFPGVVKCVIEDTRGQHKYQRVIEKIPALCPKIEKLKFTEPFTELRSFREDEFTNLSELRFCFKINELVNADYVKSVIENLASFSRLNWLKSLRTLIWCSNLALFHDITEFDRLVEQLKNLTFLHTLLFKSQNDIDLKAMETFSCGNLPKNCYMPRMTRMRLNNRPWSSEEETIFRRCFPSLKWLCFCNFFDQCSNTFLFCTGSDTVERLTLNSLHFRSDRNFSDEHKEVKDRFQVYPNLKVLEINEAVQKVVEFGEVGEHTRYCFEIFGQFLKSERACSLEHVHVNSFHFEQVSVEWYSTFIEKRLESDHFVDLQILALSGRAFDEIKASTNFGEIVCRMNEAKLTFHCEPLTPWPDHLRCEFE